VKCVLSCLRSPLLKKRKTKYKREREAKESRVNTQPAPCPLDPYYTSCLSLLLIIISLLRKVFHLLVITYNKCARKLYLGSI
jgi:hypothetical protein